MIRVIHVLTDMKIGGAGRWLMNFLRSVDKSEFDVMVVLPRGSMLVEKCTQLGVKVLEVDGMFDRSYDPKAIRFFYTLFKREKPDIVHTHASLSARIGAKLAGVKAKVNMKHWLDQPGTGLKKALDARINMGLSDRFIAVSQAVKQSMVASGINEDMVDVVYGGVDKLPEFTRERKLEIRARWNIEENDIVIGIVARLVEVKGHEYFIEAAEQVLKKHDNVKFLIAGTGPREQEIRKMAADKGLDGKVVFTGFIDKVEEVFNIIDINVITSISEALCLVLIEGMSLGISCIGTNTGGVTEVVLDGENGFVVPARDAVTLADRMNRLIEDSVLRKFMGLSGLSYMENHFLASQMARQLENIYRALIVSTGGRK